jgi:hypothetical protein
MSDIESSLSPLEIRLECLRMAVEFGTQRDVLNPVELADKYYDWVTKEGSGEIRPQDNRKDDSPKSAKNSRSVRSIG